MISIWSNKSGFALINVVVGLVIISLTIAITMNFNSYISREEDISKEEFFFYTQVNNIVEEVYHMDWNSLEGSNNKNTLIKLDTSKSIDYDYEFSKEPTKYCTRRLDLIFYDPPGTDSKELRYRLEKQI